MTALKLTYNRKGESSIPKGKHSSSCKIDLRSATLSIPLVFLLIIGALSDISKETIESSFYKCISL